MHFTYTVTTQNTPEYKSMICGRTLDIIALIEHVAQGNSVALFGEKRIGKSSLLYLIKDIIDGSVSHYQGNLIDSELKSKIASLQAKIPHYKSCYISFQPFVHYNFDTFVQQLQRQSEEAGLLSAANPSILPVNYKNMEFFEKLSATCGQGRMVILIDEIEMLKNFHSSERNKILGNLRSATAYPNICFIIAGAEDWYKLLKDESPVVSAVLKKHELVALSRFSTKQYLLHEPLEACFSPRSVDILVTTILDWTAYKPFYIQAICDIVVRTYQNQVSLPQRWQETVRDNIYNNTAGEVLKGFYGNDNIDKLAQDILALLAHTPNLTTQQIARLLGYDKKARIVQERLDNLAIFGKIGRENEKYHILGSLIEHWGSKYIEPPPIPQRKSITWFLATITVLIILFLGMIALNYAYPANKVIPLKIANGIVLLEVPISLEADQKDTISISVQNTSVTSISSVHISLVSTDIDYQSGNTNTFTLQSIDIGSKKYATIAFTVHSLPLGSELTSQVIVTEGNKSARTTFSFNIPQRFPIRKYGAMGSILLAILAGLAALKAIWDFILPMFKAFSRKNNGAT